MIVRKGFSIGLAGSIAATALLTIPVSSASAATSYKACANKKSGEMRLVVKGKKCKKGEKKLKWNTTGPQGATGPTGAPGSQGPQGTPGVQGPPGAYKAVDQLGREIGPLFGMYAGIYPMIRLSGGAIVLWNNLAADPNALPLTTPAFFYRQAGCTGDAYAVYSPPLPFDLGVVMATPPSPGSPVYRLTPGTPQAFTAASTRTPVGCAASAAAVTNAYVVKPSGTVPAVAQPMVFEPVG